MKTRVLLAVACALFIATAVDADAEMISESRMSGPDATEATQPSSGDTQEGSAPQRVVATSTAQPNDNEAGESRERTQSRLVEEIVVTAQKREENLQDVPVSVQAFSAGALEARGITDQAGLMRSTPSLDVGSQVGFVTLFLRGVGTEAFLTADPSVASYIDGVYYPFTPSIVQDFGAVKRVEVLKGPQGTLFGRNAVAGAINVITEDPDFEEATTSLQTSYSSFDTFKWRAYTNVPITDNVAANASVLYSTGDTFLNDDSVIGGQPLYRETHKGVRAKVRYAPADVLDFTVTGTYLEDNDNATLQTNYFVSPLGQALQIDPAKGPMAQSDQPVWRHFKSYVVSGQGTYNAPWFDVKLIGSEQQHVHDHLYDFDGSVRPYVSFAVGPGGDNGGLFANIEEAELQLISNDDSFGSEWLKFNLGAFYFKGRSGMDPIRATVGNITSSSLSSFGVSSPLLDALNALPLPPGLSLPVQGGAPLYSLASSEYVDTESLSEYVQVTVTFTDWVALTLGGRYQNEKRSVPKSVTTLELSDGTTIPVSDWKEGRSDAGPVPLTDRTKGFKPKVTLDFHPLSDDTLIFLSYQEAIKSATYNSYAIYLAPEFVKAEETEAYEVGIKTALFDGSMRLNVSAWRYDITNLQTQFVSLLAGGAVSFENAKKARSRGIDFDVITDVLPGSFDGLALTLNGAFVDSYFVSYPNASGYEREGEGSGLGVFSGTNDYSGNRNTRAPKFSGSATLSKTWQLMSSLVEASVDLYYNDGFYYTASNDRNFSQDAYQTVGARVSYLYEPFGLRATAFGSNLTDELYTAGMLATDFGGNYSVASGRTVGLRLDWAF